MSFILIEGRYDNLGISKRFFGRIRSLVGFSQLLQCVIPPVVGGLIIGSINWVVRHYVN